VITKQLQHKTLARAVALHASGMPHRLGNIF